MLKLVVMTCMMSAPTSVPRTVARPPVSAVPPTTVAAEVYAAATRGDERATTIVTPQRSRIERQSTRAPDTAS